MNNSKNVSLMLFLLVGLYTSVSASETKSALHSYEEQTWELAVDTVSEQKDQQVLLFVPDGLHNSPRLRAQKLSVEKLSELTGSKPQLWNKIVYIPRNVYREWASAKPSQDQSHTDELVSFLMLLKSQQLSDLSQGKDVDVKNFTPEQMKGLSALVDALAPLKTADLEHPFDKKLSIYIDEPAAFVFYKAHMAPRTLQEAKLFTGFPSVPSTLSKSGGSEGMSNLDKIIQSKLKNPDKTVILSSSTSWNLQELFEKFQGEFKTGLVKVVSQAQTLKIVVSKGSWKLKDLLTVSLQASRCEMRQVGNDIIIGQQSEATSITSQSNLNHAIEADYLQLVKLSRLLLKSPKSNVPDYLSRPMLNSVLIPYKKLSKEQSDWLSEDYSAPADFLLKPPSVDDLEVAFVPSITFEVSSTIKADKTRASTSAYTLYSWLLAREKSQGAR